MACSLRLLEPAFVVLLNVRFWKLFEKVCSCFNRLCSRALLPLWTALTLGNCFCTFLPPRRLASHLRILHINARISDRTERPDLYGTQMPCSWLSAWCNEKMMKRAERKTVFSFLLLHTRSHRRAYRVACFPRISVTASAYLSNKRHQQQLSLTSNRSLSVYKLRHGSFHSLACAIQPALHPPTPHSAAFSPPLGWASENCLPFLYRR